MEDLTKQMANRGILNWGNLAPLKKVMSKAQRGDDITLGFIGGSITMGSLSSSPDTCYAYLVYSWWCTRFPNSKIQYINAGIGGTTSHFGVARVDGDLLYASPDWVITEYSVNDDDNEYCAQTYEGLIRRILSYKKEVSIMVVNSVRYDTGENAQECHNAIAKAYNLPIISMKQSIYNDIQEGRLKKEDITPDDIHPNDVGHRLMANIIIGYLEQVYHDLENIENELVIEGLRNPITLNQYQESIRYQNYNCTPHAQGFVADNAEQANICDIFKHGWYGHKKGDKLTFRITCSKIAIQYRKTVKKPSPIAYAIIDDNSEERVKLDSNFTEDWGDCLHLENILCNGKNGEHKVEIVIEEVPPGCSTEFYLVSVIA